MTARELLAWSDRDDRRRRLARRGVGSAPPLAWSLAAGAAVFGELARRIADGDPRTASALWIAIALAVYSTVMFGAPFRLYWRRDSAFLGRLAIAGGALFRLALLRSVRAAAHALIICGGGALAFAAFGEGALAARHLALAGCGALAGALLGPAVALFAGGTVASDRAVAVLESLGGEARAPKTTWLGTLPGLAATAVAAALLAGAGWAAGADATAIGAPALLLALAAGVPIAAIAIALSVAGSMMPAAVREVAALDRERLAHVELTQPSAIESLWGRLTVPASARPIYGKDLRLARRRYPAPYFLSAAGVLALWIVAATRPDSMLQWTGLLIGGLAVYAVVMARRLAMPPVEHPRLVRTLAVRPRDLLAAKRQEISLRLLTTVILGGAPVAARAPDPTRTMIVLLAISMTTFVIGVVVAQTTLNE